MNFVKNEFEAWTEAKQTTKIYFILIKEQEKQKEVNYCSCSEEDMKNFIIKEQEDKNRNYSYRILKRKTICTFENDITDVNNMFKFFAWLKV